MSALKRSPEMKTLPLLALALILFSTPIFGELRGIVIEVHRLEEVGPTSTRITGYNYSLHSLSKDENLRKVPLEELLKMIPNIKNSGSVVHVAIKSDTDIQSYGLGKIMLAMTENAYLHLIYVEVGADSKVWGPKMFEHFGLESKEGEQDPAP